MKKFSELVEKMSSEAKTKIKLLTEEMKKKQKAIKSRSAGLKNRYGITIDEYESMLAEQKGVCFICKSAPLTRRLSVDHLHAKDLKGKQIKGKKELVRGLLCMYCNKYIVGALERRNKVKSKDVLNGLIKYFKKYPIRD